MFVTISSITGLTVTKRPAIPTLGSAAGGAISRRRDQIAARQGADGDGARGVADTIVVRRKRPAGLARWRKSRRRHGPAFKPARHGERSEAERPPVGVGACVPPQWQSGRGREAAVVAQRGPERGGPGQKQVAAKERVRPAAGAPGRIHERHATLR
ncbi:hypothetical protein [Thiocapsa roseopersicina]|uniref:Uncharacterized protein n=1 Tax=Thiocapsa roseopersicina TaxID=1058 RepID=A0A1H3DA38_THIRO|nr:hypothetical protein [Thiocapsa roseopersicina]SDX63303.1 hypothetical protein SAMN05421783_14510 [Thiocapsa roseopersicina]